MTVEELKRNVSMQDILSMYGIKYNGHKKNISCPFHKDKYPSMQIFKDGYNCYSCGRQGDIISFVMEMDNCSFKDAFYRLGGSYENTRENFFAKQRQLKAINDRKRKESAQIRQLKLKIDISNLIKQYHSNLSELEPFSDVWCACQNNIFYLMYAWEEKYIKGNEVDISGVIMRHSKLE